MSAHGLELAQAKMAAAGVHAEAIEVFSHYYAQLEEGVTGVIPEDSDRAADRPGPAGRCHRSATRRRPGPCGQTAIIKLNGGLGTSMGMDKAKSLLPVRDGKSFLDLIVEQVMSARRTHGVPLPLIFMNSFRTRDDTLAALAPYPDLAVEGLGPGLPAELRAEAAGQRPDPGRVAGRSRPWSGARPDTATSTPR